MIGDDNFDVVVVGGGPAGAAVAIALARLGRRLLMVEESAGVAARVGEALPPAARPVLRELGLLDQVASDGHLPCYGNDSIWGSDELDSSDFIFDPNGHGWHLDRPRFDTMLRKAARDSGAQVLLETKLVACKRDHDDTWTVHLDDPNGNLLKVRSDWIVDATGRKSTVASRCRAVRLRDDALVAFHAHFQPGGIEQSCSDGNSRTVVEAMPDGWCYSALVPNGGRVVAYMTDRDLVNRAALLSPESFLRRIEESRHIGPLLLVHGFRIDGRPRGADACSSRLQHFSGSGWLAVGDAALGFDPLSSQGLLFGLTTGIRAGRAIHDALLGDADPVAEYARQLREFYGAYRRNLAFYYAAEERWRDRPFWQRRNQLSSVP